MGELRTKYIQEIAFSSGMEGANGTLNSIFHNSFWEKN